VFSDRRGRGLEAAKWAAYVREVEANVDRRITRVEQALEGQSGLIEDLHSKSVSTEDSVRKLLTAVEGFCAQTTRQLEAISPPAAAPALAAAIPEAPVAEVPAAAYAPAPAVEPVAVQAPIAETIIAATIKEPESSPVKPPQQAPLPAWTPPAQTARKAQPSQPDPAEFGWAQKLDWRLAGGAALVVVGAIIIGAWAWQNLFSEPSVQRVAATSAPVISPTTPAPHSQPPQPSQTPQPQTAAKPAASAFQHVTLEASELTWVSIRDAAGKQLLARVFQSGDTQSLDLPDGAIVRLGNAGGLSILLNGNSIGAIGKHGQVSEVVFRNNSYKIVMAN
jgi:hypothetical protein